MKITKKVIEPVKKVKKSNYYIDNTFLLKHLIISKGKGKCSKQLESMLLLINSNASIPFSKYFRNKEDEFYDCKMGAYMHLFQNWKKFDTKKFDDGNALAYLTEIYKREFTQNYNYICLGKKHHNAEPILTVSLSLFYNEGNNKNDKL